MGLLKSRPEFAQNGLGAPASAVVVVAAMAVRIPLRFRLATSVSSR